MNEHDNSESNRLDNMRMTSEHFSTVPFAVAVFLLTGVGIYINTPVYAELDIWSLLFIGTVVTFILMFAAGAVAGLVYLLKGPWKIAFVLAYVLLLIWYFAR